MDKTKDGGSRVLKFPKTPTNSEDEILRDAEARIEAQIEALMGDEEALENIMQAVIGELAEADIIQGQAVHPRVITTALAATIGYTLEGFTSSGPDLLANIEILEAIYEGAELCREANPDFDPEGSDEE